MSVGLKQIASKIAHPFGSMSRKNWFLLTISIFAGMSVFLVWTTAPKPAVLEAEEESWPVTVITAAPQPMSPQITLYGRVETPRTATLNAAVHARVESVPAREGQTVLRDEILVVLEDTDTQLMVDRCTADVQEAEAGLKSLQLQHRDNQEILNHEKRLYELKQKEVERYRKLKARQSVSEENMSRVLREAHSQAISLQAKSGVVRDYTNRLARSEARLRRARANLKEAQTLLERTVIRAPFDGRITRVFPAPGERVNIGMNLVEIYDTAALEIRAQIPLRVLPGIQHHIGRSGAEQLTATVRIGGADVKCPLDRLSGMVGSGQSGIDGLFAVPATRGDLVLGRVLNLTLDLPAETDVVAVPIQSIYGENRIYRVSEGRLEGLTVDRIGESTDADGQFTVLVRSPDLVRGDQIVTTQLPNAMSGLKVSANGNGSANGNPLPMDDSV